MISSNDPQPMFAPPWSHLLLFVLALTALPASAASLGETVTAALTQGGQQQRVAALRGERDAVRSQAGSLIAADPALRLKGLSDRMTENDGAYELEAMVDMPMWLPGQRSARIAVAESLGMRADALQRLLRWEAAGQVREAAWEATLAHGQLRQAAAALQAAKSLEATVAKRTDAGELARMELLTARQETAARGVDMSAAQLGYDQAIAAFVLLTGQPRLPEPLTEAVPNAFTAGDIGMALPPNHPLLASADGALAQARAERDRASAERRGHPLLSLGGKRARDDRTVNPVDAVQLEVSVPFGLKRQAAPMLAVAEREYTDRMTELHRIRREAERDLKAAALAQRGAGDALVLARERAQLAGDALTITRRAFDLGEADLAALLRAEERARDASLALELRSLEQGRAVARLNQALGVVPE
jgi:outer membrane protein, heavy metal efflux system